MRISDWSSDVCSSDLGNRRAIARHSAFRSWCGPRPCPRSMGGVHARIKRALCLDHRLPSQALGEFSRRSAVQHARSEEHTSELQSLMRISYAVFCLKKKNTTKYNKSKRYHKES